MCERLQDPIMRKARKDHQCMGCLRVIKSGEEYSDEVFSEEGKAYNWRVCKNCVEFIETPGDFHEEYLDWIEEGVPEGFVIEICNQLDIPRPEWALTS